MPQLLSKSRYLNGLQCPRLLWIATNHPERIPEPDATTQHIFDQGHRIGELAKKLYPEGIDLPHENFMGNISMAKKLLLQRTPLFEAGVLSGHIYSRVDILNPVNENKWDIIEVKSATSVKEVNFHDVAFQRLCWEDGGQKIRKCFLGHINNQYVKNGEIDPKELFVIEDISDEVAAASEGIRDRITQMLEVIGMPACPEVTIGPHCSDPYGCPLAECWDGLPAHNVFTLYYGGERSYELYRGGVLDIAKIPSSYRLNDRQRIQRACVVSGKPYVDKDALRGFLAGLEYPLYFLDFETFGTAIPMFDGTSPYQNTPFQFSLHIQETPGREPRHSGFLAKGREDPRPELLASLSRLIGHTGSVIAYNKPFEEGVLEDLGNAFPEYAGWTANVVSRLVDLILPFRNFYYYHPLQKGSASLKAVLPAITGKGYDDLDISDGQAASTAFLAAAYGGMPEEERANVMSNLEEYCGRDTEGMIWIVDKFRELCV